MHHHNFQASPGNGAGTKPGKGDLGLVWQG